MIRKLCFLRCCGKRKYSNKTIPTNINPKDIKTFIPEITEGRVIKCYDGDTITVAAYLPFKESELYKFSVRINGILINFGGLISKVVMLEHEIHFNRKSRPPPISFSFRISCSVMSPHS